MAASSQGGPENPRAATCSIPDHELLKPIGRGSYGEVWLVRNVLGEFRAVKIVWRHEFGDDARPFQREFEGIRRFEPISRSHPSQLAILHVGRNDEAGCFYYVMELADANVAASVSLRANSSARPTAPPVEISARILTDAATYSPRTLRSELKTRGALPVAEVVELGLALTTALAHLHAQGLVHRDIKPSNIVFVGGRPKLADIGLVTDAATGDDTRSIVGTEGYLAPEGPGRVEADIFALGKVLYEAATGLDRRQFPQLPPDLRTRPDANALIELNEVFLKACIGDARERYQSADAMRADLELLQRGKSIKQKRTAQGRLRIVKRICAVVVLLALSSAVLGTLLRGSLFDTSDSAYRLSKNQFANREYQIGDEWSHRDTTEGLTQAREHFNRAIKWDQNFIMAYNGLFEVYIQDKDLGLSAGEVTAKLRFYASKLMKLAPKLAEARAAQAYVDFSEGKWELVEPQFRYAIKLNSKCVMAHNLYGFCLYTAGRSDEALEEFLLADTLAPTRPSIKKNIGNAYYAKRIFRAAIKRYEEAIKFQLRYPSAHQHLGFAWRALDNYTNAINEFQQAQICLGKDEKEVKEHFDQHRRAYTEGGPGGYWSNCLAEAQAAHDLVWQAECQAHFTNYPQALTLLEQANATNDNSLRQSLLFMESFDPIHADPRFVELLKKTGLRK
ncbi:MAG: tetratricopeptide repeat protein [Verrucomicrobia bacterium]|nr:tetratricopeptide repeat protein [Verrucomicrobiota bacterium]